ncbi:MAG: ABC transporter permease [Clostridia bacterium]|nr:ABC transporter permease [Clostridia bacterium]
MNIKHILIVFKKEMKDCFRDKKSVISNILLPIFLIPIMYSIMNMVMTSTTKEIENNMKIGIVYTQNIEQAKSFTQNNIVATEKIDVLTYSNEQDATENLMNGNINCVIIYPQDFFENMQNSKISDIKLKFNSTKNSSQSAIQIISSKFAILNSNLAAGKLKELNIPTEILSLITIKTEDAHIVVDSGENKDAANGALIMILPMYLGIIIVTAGMPLALDLFAGERERNTFEALFSTKAKRLSILLGKYAAVLVFSIIAIFTSFIGLILGIVMNPEMFIADKSETLNITTILASLNMSLSTLILVLLSCITLAIVFGGIQIAISTYAKSLKGAQTYLSYITILAMIPSFASMMLGAGDMKMFMSFIPIFNTVSSLKMTLSGIVNNNFLFTSIAVNLVFSAIVSYIVIKMFKNEKIIVR